MSEQPSGVPDGAPEQASAGAPASEGAPAPAQAPTPPPATRPARPAYGEYAPEGWEWKPEGDAGAGSGAATAAGSGASAATASSSDASRVPARPAGVPHNLGAPARDGDAGGAAGARTPQAPAAQAPQAPQAPQQSVGEPYRAAAPQVSGAPAPAQLPPAYRTPGAGGPRIGDRVVTIILLALGGFGALNIAGSFFGLEAQLRLTSTMLGIESPSIAGWVGPLGVVSGLIVLLLFALTLIFSIQRMRANKLTFWVPLAAGAVAFIILMIVPMIAMSGAPEIMQQLQSDPTGSLDKMLDYLSEMQTP